MHPQQSCQLSIFSARCNIYISRLCYNVSVHLSVTEVHWVAVHAGNTVAAPASEVEAIIRSQTNMAAADGGVISCYASHCYALLYFSGMTAFRMCLLRHPISITNHVL